VHKFSKNLNRNLKNSRHQTGDIKQVHTEDPQILGTTEQNLVIMVT